jgi:hypothetical protein
MEIIFFCGKSVRIMFFCFVFHAIRHW